MVESGIEIKMIQVGMFTWNGTRDELKTYVGKYEEACKKNGLVSKGLHAPLQEPYHYAFIIDNKLQNMDHIVLSRNNLGSLLGNLLDKDQNQQLPILLE